MARPRHPNEDLAAVPREAEAQEREPSIAERRAIADRIPLLPALLPARNPVKLGCPQAA
jgi:hypothetical protein